MKMARENAKDIIAMGFDVNKTFIFSNLDFVGYENDEYSGFEIRIDRYLSDSQQKMSGNVPKHDSHPEVRDIQSGERHIRFWRFGSDWQNRIPSCPSSSIIFVHISVHIWQSKSELLDSVRNRPGSIFPDDARRCTAHRFPEASVASFDILSSAARSQDEDVGQ